MRFSEYQATKMKSNNESPQQQGEDPESAALLLQRYRNIVAKDRKAGKYMNQKVDLAEAAWRAKRPSTHYAEMDQLIAQAREDETKRQEEEEVVEKKEQQQKEKPKQQQQQQPTYHRYQNTVATTQYIDEKFAYMEASMQEKLHHIEMTLDEKIAIALAQQHHEADPASGILNHHHGTASTNCAMLANGHFFAAHNFNNLFSYMILLGCLICLFGWYKSSSQIAARKSLVNPTKGKKFNEDGWEEVDKSSSSSSSSRLAKKERVLE